MIMFVGSIAMCVSSRELRLSLWLSVSCVFVSLSTLWLSDIVLDRLVVSTHWGLNAGSGPELLHCGQVQFTHMGGIKA